jgi:hypothetical protein
MVKDCSVMMLVTDLIAQFCVHVVQVSIIQPERTRDMDMKAKYLQTIRKERITSFS